MPLNVWLPWLPQLQTSLQRPEAALVKDLLAQLATTYPQAVYYGLRTILLSLREVHYPSILIPCCSSSLPANRDVRQLIKCAVLVDMGVLSTDIAACILHDLLNRLVSFN